MRIFVPSRGRFHRMTTRHRLMLDELNKYEGFDVKYVVPHFEADHWDRAGLPIIKVPDDWKFSQIRQKIAELDGDEHVCVDDDLMFYRRAQPWNENDVKLYDTTWEDIVDLFRWIRAKFDQGYVHGGISAREGNNRAKNQEEDCVRITRFHFYRADILRKVMVEHNFRFDQIRSKQDFHCTLSLLRLGYPNITTFEFAQNQDNHSNERGGCDWYRNAQTMAEDAQRLADLHPEFVTVVDKWTDKAWGGGWRKDVRIQWKKALGAGLKW